MESTVINKQITVEYPQGFAIMSEEEREGLNSMGAAPLWAMRDSERHIIMTVSWKIMGKLMVLLFKPKETAVRMESQYSEAMAPYGYRSEGFMSRLIAGKPVEGYRYSYTVEDVEMCGESWCMRHNDTYYYMHVYYRKALREESLKLIETIYDSMVWKAK